MVSKPVEQCIEACHACANTCDRCMLACLGEAAPGALARCIQLDMDCAGICRLAAAFLGRSSEFANALCGLCATVCDACAQECAKYPMEHCRVCADACRVAADSCRRAMATAIA
ncbi:MAG: four-helix bundle copper-binding protein [Gammaproteobacteria bacterium]|nr:four-helix bundle copper-binding protein [Gammaproteobacteria bacterium]